MMEEEPPAPGGMEERAPPTPAASGRDKFFPIPLGYSMTGITRAKRLGDGENPFASEGFWSIGAYYEIPPNVAPGGVKLNELQRRKRFYWESVTEHFTTAPPIPEFTVFNFGAANNMNGIPVQKATATQADRYAAVAYQAILEHSMFLFQGGFYHYETGGVTGGHPILTGFSLGKATPSGSSGRCQDCFGNNPIAGTWNGVAVGVESLREGEAITREEFRRPNPLNADNVTGVTADVEIKVVPQSNPENWGDGLTLTIDNWKGATGDYGTARFVNFSASGTVDEENIHMYEAHLVLSPVRNFGTADMLFYGPKGEEVGGTFEIQGTTLLSSPKNQLYFINGVFAAKKQP